MVSTKPEAEGRDPMDTEAPRTARVRGDCEPVPKDPDNRYPREPIDAILYFVLIFALSNTGSPSVYSICRSSTWV